MNRIQNSAAAVELLCNCAMPAPINHYGILICCGAQGISWCDKHSLRELLSLLLSVALCCDLKFLLI